MKWTIAVLLALLGLAGCNKEVKDKDKEVVKVKPAIGRYLLLDNNDVLHVDENCLCFLPFGEGDNLKIYGKTYIDTTSFYSDRDYRYCTQCVEEPIYERIKVIMHRYHERFVTNIHKKLVDAGREVCTLDDLTQHKLNRTELKALYDACVELNIYDDTFEKFSKESGYYD
jgi:hypothetical protein